MSTLYHNRKTSICTHAASHTQNYTTTKRIFLCCDEHLLTEETQPAKGTVMPPKRVVPPKKAQARRSEQCILCTQRIADGRDQALFCTGKCQGFVHRYCAGVSEAHFLALSKQFEQLSKRSTKSSEQSTLPALQSGEPSTPWSTKSTEPSTQQSERSAQSTTSPKLLMCLVCT